MPKQRTGYVYYDKKRKSWTARLKYKDELGQTRNIFCPVTAGRHGRKKEVTSRGAAPMKGNSGADNDGVECRSVRRFGRGACPEITHRIGVWARPETPHRLAAACKLIGSADTPFPLSQRQIVTSRAALRIN
jgi:hypothetical protein